MAANVGLTLAQVLAEIYNASSTCLAVGEKRRLAARALAMAMRAEIASTTDDMLEHFEGVLSTIQTAMGLDQLPSVTKGKDLLRKAGATQLASRVGRLSRRRNGHAHPDVSLDGDILRHFQTAAVASKTEGNSQQHEPEAEASASPEELGPYGHKDEQKDKALRIELDATTARLAQATNQLQEQAVQHTKEVSAFKDTLATNQDEYASLVGERDGLRTKLEAAQVDHANQLFQLQRLGAKSPCDLPAFVAYFFDRHSHKDEVLDRTKFGEKVNDEEPTTASSSTSKKKKRG